MEEVVKCVDLEKIRNHGMTLEEFGLISKCNGVFTEIFRPDENEKETQNKMMKYLTVRWKNTFEGRSFIDGLKLLTKPAIKPTITDDENK